MADAALPRPIAISPPSPQARALARRAKQAGRDARRALPGADRRHRRRDGRGRHARRPRPLRALAVEETGYGVVDDKIQKNLFASDKVYEFIRPMKTVGVVARHERPPRHRDRRAVRRRRRRRAVDQPDVDGHLQDPHRAQGALRDRPQPAPFGGAVHHARRRGARGGRAPRRRARGRRHLDDDGDARGHAGADEAPRRGGHPRDRRHGARPRGLQRRQAGLRCRPRQRARPTSSAPRTSARPSATSSPARRSTTACSARPRTRSSSTRRSPRRCKREFQAQGGYFMSTAEIDAVASVLVTPQRLPNPALVGQDRDGHRREVRHHRSRPDTRVLHRAARRRRPRLPAVDREALSGPLLLRRPRLARGLRALQADPPLRRDGPHDVHPLAERSGDPGVRPARSRPSGSSSTRRRTHGSIGLTTGLDPAMTLGCGGYGGNITSDNISPRHLLNIKRLAYEIDAGRQPVREGPPAAAGDRPAGRASPPKR